MNGFARRTVVTLSAALLLAACASAPGRSETDARKAAETNTALGRQYLDRGQYEISLEKLKRAVAFDETYAPAHTMLGVLYETIGDREMAEAEYRKAVRHDPTDGSVNNNLGAFLCGVGKREEADRFFRTAIEDPFYQTPQVAQSNAGSSDDIHSVLRGRGAVWKYVWFAHTESGIRSSVFDEIDRDIAGRALTGSDFGEPLAYDPYFADD